MQGKVCVVTGANSGIGKVTARELAKRGAKVVMICRNPQRAEAARAEIRAAAPDAEVDLLLADLGELAQVRRVADEYKARYDQLHVLVNNAGVYLPRRMTTSEGFESTFAINHLGPFLLTNLLEEVLEASAPARVVNVSSEGHRAGKVDLSDLNSERGRYRGLRVYCTSKLMNILFSNELSRRMRQKGVTSNALHPGAIASGFAQDERGLFKSMMKVARPFLLTTEQGARTQIHLATSPEVEGISGEYWRKSRIAAPSRAARDLQVAGRLWDASRELSGLA